MTAIPEDGWAFREWTGAAVGSALSANVTMTADKSVNAIFEQLQLTVSKVGEGTVTPPGGGETLPHTIAYGSPQTVGLTASPAAGWGFKEWTGDASGENPSTSVVVDGSRAVTAVFAQVELKVDKEGEGTVSVSPPGGAQTLPYTGTYGFGDVVTLTAGEATGWQFDHWEGDVPSGDANTNPLSLELDGDKDVTAVFHVKLQVHGVDHATISSPFNLLDWLFPGSGVQLSATPDQGYKVAFWKITVQPDGGGQGAGLMQMTMGTGGFVQYLMGASVSYTVVLPTDAEPVVRPDGKYYLLVESEWVDGQSVGHVTVNANAAPVEGPTDLGQGRTLYLFNQYTDFVSNPPIPVVVTLEGMPDAAGWAFDEWEGDIVPYAPDANPITLTMDQDRDIKATFTDTVYLTVDVEGEGTVSVNPDQSEYAIGDVVSLTASGVGGWMIHHWIDTDGNPTEHFESEISVTMNQDHHITAVFYRRVALEVEVDGPGWVAVDGEFREEGGFAKYYDYFEGQAPETPLMRAYPDDGAKFVEWQGDSVSPGPGENPVNIAMDDDKNVTAVFEVVNVTFEEASSQKYGFDDFTDQNLPWKSVADQDTDTVRAEISMPSPSDVRFDSAKPNVVTSSPAFGTGGSTTLTLDGNAVGEGAVHAVDSAASDELLATLGVKVYPPIQDVKVIIRTVLLRAQDDVQEVAVGESPPGATSATIGVSFGPNGVSDTRPLGDDQQTENGIALGENRVCDTPANHYIGASEAETFDLEGIETYLNGTVFNQCAVSFDVSYYSPPAVVDYDLYDPQPETMDDYHPDGMLNPQFVEWSAIRDNAAIPQEEAYHVFVVRNIAEEGGTAAFAIPDTPWLFLTEALTDFNQVLAHELGHAFGTLLHTPLHDDIVNLMEIHAGPQKTKLRVEQWDTIHSKRKPNNWYPSE